MSFYLESRSFGATAIVRGELTDVDCSEISYQGVDAVEFNYSLGWEGTGFERVRKLSGVHSISLLPSLPINIAPIHDLENLKNLYVGGEAYGELDLSVFHGLKQLWGNYHKKLCVTGFENVSSVRVLGGNLREELWANIHKFKNLRRLRATLGLMSSIPSLTPLISLHDISLDRFKNLTNIDAVSELRELRKLSIDSCKKIYDFSVARKLHNLEWLSMDSCKTIRNIEFIEPLKKLKVLTFNEDSNIETGDLGAIGKSKQLEYVSFMNRKNYNFRREDFQLTSNFSLQEFGSRLSKEIVD